MSTGPSSPRRLALESSLTKPTNQVAYLLTVAGLSIALGSKSHIIKILGGLVSSGALASFCAYRYLVSKVYTDLYDKWFKEDLADIATYYRMVPAQTGSEDLVPSSDNGFWVAECDRPEGGTEIVGCVALDCTKVKDGVPHAELRRMLVSPNHRRKGIASLLLNTLLGHARDRNISTLHLTTTEYQKAAINAYKTSRWIETGRTPIRIWNGFVRVILVHFRLDLGTTKVTDS
ncbi:hypothetical protein H0H92_012499, partial [Tricholoma furcatifolium]